MTCNPFFEVSEKAKPPRIETLAISGDIRLWPKATISAKGPASVKRLTLGGTIGSRTETMRGVIPPQISCNKSAASAPRSLWST